MTENQFDDSLKNKIRDHHSPVPDDMWERIIQKKDKDRKGFLFFFRWFAILLLGVCLGGYLLLNHTKQKPGPVSHVLSNKDQKVSQSGFRMNEEKVRAEENTRADIELPVRRKKSSYPSRTTGELKENDSDNGLYSDIKTDSKQSANGLQNSFLQKDSLSRKNQDSATNKPEAVIEPITKPALSKSPVDSLQKSLVKKTQQDSVARKKWYLDVFASPDFPIDQTPYPSSPFANEQLMLSFTVGLRVNRSFGKHFSAKLGIQFSQINFRINADSNLYHGQINHLKSFDLPFSAGYSFGTEKLKMTITAGGIANLYTFFKGDAFADEFKTNTGFSLYAGFNMERKINQKISIYLEPYYRYRLTAMTVSTTQYHKFIDVVGLTFGARYYFLKKIKK